MLGNSLWYASVIAVGIAIVGTLTSLLIPNTPASHPLLALRAETFFVPRDTWQFILGIAQLRNSLLVAMMFWFIGGVTQPAVNSLGEHIFHLSKTRTSLLAASIGVGIALGCLVAGVGNRRPEDGRKWVRIGSWLTVLALVIIGVLSSGVIGRPVPSSEAQSLMTSLVQADSVQWMMRGSMFFLGFSAGAFVVPIQVYIQETPPPEQKGRVLGALNLLSWIGIVLSAGFFGLANSVADAFGTEANQYEYRYCVFGALALAMLPVALFYRLRDSPGSPVSRE